MSDRISDERAIEILTAFVSGDDRVLDAVSGVQELEACRMGAAAIAAQRELVDALERWISETSHALPLKREHIGLGIDYHKQSLDLLVRFGRVTKDGDSYSWTSK